MTIQGGVVLVEQDRLLGHRIAGLGRVPAVVEPDADDLFWIGHAGSERRLVKRNKIPICGCTCPRFLGEAAQRVGVSLAMQQRVDRGRRALAKVLLGGDDVENAAVGAQPQPVAVRTAQRGEHQAFRQLFHSG